MSVVRIVPEGEESFPYIGFNRARPIPREVMISLRDRLRKAEGSPWQYEFLGKTVVDTRYPAIQGESDGIVS